MKQSLFFILSMSLIFLAACGSETAIDTQNLQCGYDFNEDKVTIDACDKSCVTRLGCQAFVGTCISSHENPYFPETLSVAYERVRCSCVDKVCVAKPTGEIAI